MSDHHQSHEPQYPAFATLFSIIELIGRVPVMLASMFVVAVTAGGIAQWTFGSYWISAIAACLAISSTIGNFLVSVPEITGLVTINIFTGELAVYGTGFSVRFPWEQVEEGNYINMRQVPKIIEETYPSTDSTMATKWQFLYTPTLDGLPKYISADDDTIKTGLAGLGGSVLGFEIGIRSSAQCKAEKDLIENKVKDQFVEDEDSDVLTPWALYGITIDRVSITDLDFDLSVQEARSNMEVGRRIREMAADIRKEHPDISGKEAMNLAMITNGKTAKQIFEIEGLAKFAESLAGIVEKFNKKAA